MVTGDRLIAAEIAATYGRAVTTVQSEWMTDPAWPAPAGKRGHWNEYDAGEVAAAVAVITGRPPLEGDPGELLPIGRAADEMGIAESTIRSRMSRGTWPARDDDGPGPPRWKRSTLAGIPRRPYRRRAR